MNINDPYNDSGKYNTRLRIGYSSPARSGSVIVHSKPSKSLKAIKQIKHAEF